MSLKDKLKQEHVVRDVLKLKKILSAPHGPEALELAIAEKAHDEQAKKFSDKPIVAILVPTNRTPHPRMQSKLLEMKNYCRKNAVCEILSMPLINNSVIHWSRNDLVSELLKSRHRFTHILFIDDDIVPEEDHLERMLAHGVDIVAALCTFRQDPPIPNARMYDPISQRFSELKDWSVEGLIQADAAGTGMMLISLNALQQVAEVWFQCKVEQKLFGVSDEWVTKVSAARTAAFDNAPNAWWFDFLPTPDNTGQFGEDVSFCIKAKQYAGLNIWVDTTINPEHMGTYGYSIADYRSQRKEAARRAQQEGRLLIRPDATTLKNAQSEPLKISILVPTRGRPENVKRLIDSLVSTSNESSEVIFYFDEDDPTLEQLYEAAYFPPETVVLAGGGVAHHGDIHAIVGPRRCLSECWNECAKVASGDILMHAGDDIVFKTKDWDVMVKNAFRSVPDKIIFVHGEDGLWGKKFGTHGFIHRKWMETVGYFVPPYFSSDYNDTWLNEVANALQRRVYLPFETEHFHPLIKGADGKPKAEWDQTHKERLERHKNDKMDELWESKKADRLRDIEKLRAVIEHKPELVTA